MSKNIADSLNLQQLEEINLKDGREYGYYTTKPLVKKFKHKTAFIFAGLEVFSAKKGWCYAKLSFLVEEFCLNSLDALNDSLDLLEKEKYIWRNSYNTPTGRHTDIVTHTNAVRYWRNFLNRPKIPQEVKDRFWNHFFPSDPIPTDPNKSKTFKPSIFEDNPMQSAKMPDEKSRSGKKPTAYMQSGKIPTAYKQVYNNKKETNDGTRAPARPSSSSFILALESDLIKNDFPKDHLEKALLYSEHHQESIEKANNPTGLLISLKKNGVIDRFLEEKQEEKVYESKKIEVEEANRQAAKEFQASHQEHSDSVVVGVKEDRLELNIKDSKIFNRTGFAVLSYKDFSFQEQLKTIGRKLHDYYRNTWQAHRMAAST